MDFYLVASSRSFTNGQISRKQRNKKVEHTVFLFLKYQPQLINEIANSFSGVVLKNILKFFFRNVQESNGQVATSLLT